MTHFQAGTEILGKVPEFTFLPVEPSNIPDELVRLKAWYAAIIRPKRKGKPGLERIVSSGTRKSFPTSLPAGLPTGQCPVATSGETPV